MPGQLGFFDLEDRTPAEQGGRSVEKLASVVDFEPFRYRLLKALKRSDGAKGGRPPYDPMFGTLTRTNGVRSLTVQDFDPSRLYGMSDDQAEFQIRDRLTFIRFLGLGPGDAVPDAKTIWLFREHLTGAGAVETLFARFDTLLRDKGYGDVRAYFDASLIPAPRQHLDDGEKAAIKDGKNQRWRSGPISLRRRRRKTSMPVGRSSIPGPSRLQRARRPSPTSPFRCSGTRTISASIDARAYPYLAGERCSAHDGARRARDCG